MDSLPYEILHKVFTRVSFQQRLQCLYTCRHLYNALYNRSLLNNIEFNDECKFKQFVNFIQHRPSHGAQVEILDLQFIPSSNYDCQKLLNLFPKLRKIRLMNKLMKETKQGFLTLIGVSSKEDDIPYSQLIGYRMEESDYTPWNKLSEFETIDSKIEEVKDFHDCELILQLIRTSSCARLTSLELGLFGIYNLGEELFVYLKNTPVLKDLRLHDCYIEIDDCEVLHKNTPALENFGLSLFDPIHCELPRNVIPATSIKSFSIEIKDVGGKLLYSNWYVYFAKKYPNLAHFDYLDGNIANVDADQAMTIYRDGILALFKNVKRKQLNIFHADNVPTELDLFNTLSTSGFRFESFHFSNNYNRSTFTQFAESDLPKYVKHIKLIQTICNSPILFQNFSSLKSLEISTNDLDINLTEYLNQFPLTLNLFKVHCKELEIRKLPTHSSSIEDLYIRCKTITPELCNVISNYFPSLNRIFLRGFSAESQSINLPNNHFSLIDIGSVYFGDLTHGSSVTNTENVQPRYFVGEKPKDEKHHSILVPATVTDLQDRVKKK